MVCEYLGSVVDVYDILKSCGGVMVFCGELRVVNVFGILKNCGSVIVVYEYN